LTAGNRLLITYRCSFLEQRRVFFLLCDISGRELFEVYNGFATVGTFTKSINTDNLSKGVYLLKVVIDKDFTVEKFVVE
jgi:hypothetical protein